MFSLQSIRTWLLSRRPKPLSELLTVEFDDARVKVLVLEKLDLAWNQEFAWADISRVCFKDEGLYSSDSIIIQVVKYYHEQGLINASYRVIAWKNPEQFLISTP